MLNKCNDHEINRVVSQRPEIKPLLYVDVLLAALKVSEGAALFFSLVPCVLALPSETACWQSPSLKHQTYLFCFNLLMTSVASLFFGVKSGLMVAPLVCCGGARGLLH